MLYSVLMVIESTFAIYAQQVRLPAEWEDQEMVYMSFFGATRRDTISYLIIEALQPHVNITLHFWHDSIVNDVKKQMASYRIDTSRIAFHMDPDAILLDT